MTKIKFKSQLSLLFSFCSPGSDKHSALETQEGDANGDNNNNNNNIQYSISNGRRWN